MQEGGAWESEVERSDCCEWRGRGCGAEVVFVGRCRKAVGPRWWRLLRRIRGDELRLCERALRSW